MIRRSVSGREFRRLRPFVASLAVAMAVTACLGGASGAPTSGLVSATAVPSVPGAATPGVTPGTASASNPAPSPMPALSSPNVGGQSVFAFPDGLDMTLATPLAADDGHFYFPDPDGTSILSGDWTSGATRTLVALPAGHHVAELVAADGWLVYDDAWKDVQGTQQTPCMTNSQAPLHWKIVALSLATREQVAVDEGTSTRTTAFPGDEICPGPAAPSLAVSGTVLAYTREDPVPGHPLRERVLARLLPGGTLVSQAEAAGAVTGLAALAAADGSTPLVAWVEQPVTGSDRLVLASPGKPDGGEVTTGVESVALSRSANGVDRLTWVALAADQATRSIWSADLGAQPTRIDAGLHRGWTPIAAAGGRVAWGQIATDTGRPVPLSAWDTARGRLTSVPTSIDPIRIWLTSSGWLAWAGDGLDAAGRIIERGYAVVLPGE